MTEAFIYLVLVMFALAIIIKTLFSCRHEFVQGFWKNELDGITYRAVRCRWCGKTHIKVLGIDNGDNFERLWRLADIPDKEDPYTFYEKEYNPERRDPFATDRDSEEG